MSEPQAQCPESGEVRLQEFLRDLEEITGLPKAKAGTVRILGAVPAVMQPQTQNVVR